MRDKSSSARRRIALICLAIFALAFGVRWLTWQNDHSSTATALSGLTGEYRANALILAGGDVRTFLVGRDPPTDASVLAHPPGYSIFLAFVHLVFGGEDATAIVQLLLCSAIPLVVFLFLKNSFGERTGIVAAVLVALSPQLAYNSALMLPDAIFVLPVLGAVWFFARLVETGGVRLAATCGFLIGVSCWLRPNSLLLPVAAFAALVLIKRTAKTLMPAGVLMIAFLLTIAPITIRNVTVFGTFIPLSLGSGVTFLEGIADIDAAGRFTLPASDEEVMTSEAARYGRPDYAGSLYSPDGLERERFRRMKGLETVSEDPLWFLGTVAKRASSFLRLERVPTIASGRQPERYWDLPLYLVQRLFVTAVFLPLFGAGVLLLSWRKEDRKKLATLLIVPVYFLCFQSWFHTEYRYLLAVHCFQLMIAGVAISKAFEIVTKWLNAYRLAGAE